MGARRNKGQVVRYEKRKPGGVPGFLSEIVFGITNLLCISFLTLATQLSY